MPDETTNQSTWKGAITVFADVRGYKHEAMSVSWEDLHKIIAETNGYATKKDLPLIKLGSFKRLAAKGAVRQDANMVSMCGIEGDYDCHPDDEFVSFEEAVGLTRASGVKALLYTSASYSIEKPKWRIICPLSREYLASEGDLSSIRAKFTARANGMLKGVFAAESFKLSQTYYFGRPDTNDTYKVMLVDGEYIDLVESLDSIAVDGSKSKEGCAVSENDFQERVESLGRKMNTGDGKREMLLSFIGKRLSDGHSPADVMLMVKGISSAYFEDGYNEEDVNTMISDLYAKEVVKNAEWQSKHNERRRKTTQELMVVGDGDELAPIAPRESLTLEEMLEKYVFIRAGNRVANIDRPRSSYTVVEVRTALSNAFTSVKVGKTSKEILTYDLWQSHDDTKMVETLTFVAGGPRFVKSPENGQWYLNVWKPFPKTTMSYEDAWLIVKPFIKHIEWLFGERFKDFLQWLAHIQQHPGELPHYGWLHIATRTGMGRNMIAAAIARTWPGHVAGNFDLVRTLTNGFNGRLSGKLIAIVDEINEGGGNDQWRHSEHFKSLLNEETRTINEKHMRAWEEQNACRWLLFSNHVTAIPLAQNDRRLEVVKCTDEPKGMRYYKALYDLIRLDDRFPDAMRSFLNELTLEGFDPFRHAKMSVAKLEMIASTASGDSYVLRHVIENWPCPVITASHLVGMFKKDNELPQVTMKRVKRLLADLGVPAGVQFAHTQGSETSILYQLRELDKWSIAAANPQQLRDYCLENYKVLGKITSLSDLKDGELARRWLDGSV